MFTNAIVRYSNQCLHYYKCTCSMQQGAIFHSRFNPFLYWCLCHICSCFDSSTLQLDMLELAFKLQLCWIAIYVTAKTFWRYWRLFSWHNCNCSVLLHGVITIWLTCVCVIAINQCYIQFYFSTGHLCQCSCLAVLQLFNNTVLLVMLVLVSRPQLCVS